MARRHHRHDKDEGDKDESKAASIPDRVKSLESKIKLMSQKMKNIEKNNKVVGQTVINLKKKVKKLKKESGKEEGGVSKEDIEEIKEEVKESVSGEGGASEESVEEINKKLDDLEEKVSDLNSSMAEAQYVLDTINPMEYATVDQVKDVVDRRIKKKMEESE